MSSVDDRPATDDWLRPGDEAILEFLREERAQYPALIASNTGQHAPVVERRCELLAEDGLVEPISGEVVYRITRQGVAYLEE